MPMQSRTPLQVTTSREARVQWKRLAEKAPAALRLPIRRNASSFASDHADDAPEYCASSSAERGARQCSDSTCGRAANGVAYPPGDEAGGSTHSPRAKDRHSPEEPDYVARVLQRTFNRVGDFRHFVLRRANAVPERLTQPERVDEVDRIIACVDVPLRARRVCEIVDELTQVTPV